MKLFKLIILLAVLTVVSCDKTDETDNYIDYYYYYNLHLSFQDASGNDLVKGLFDTSEDFLGRDVHTLGVIFPTHWQSYTNGFAYYVEAKRFKEMYPELKKEYDHLIFTASYYVVRNEYGVVIKLPFAEKVTFRFKCPYIFGDDAEHEIVTWWNWMTRKNKMSVALCYRIELDGNAYSNIMYVDDEYASVATVFWTGK